MAAKARRPGTFDGAVAIITGGASGIGRALGQALARRGGRVVLADVDSDPAEEAATAIRGQGGVAESAYLDVTDADAVRALVDDVAARHGRLDYMFNNAGIGAPGGIEAVSLESWNLVIDVNLRGVVHGVAAAYPRMLEQGFGHIVNTASMAGLTPTPMAASYCATKHAVVGLSRTLRAEARTRGVRVSVLCPGPIRTPILSGGRHGVFVASVSEQAQREFTARTFERMRPMDVNDFAEQALERIARDQAIIILPRAWRLSHWLNRLAPSAIDWIVARMAAHGRREYERMRVAR